jgi:hypothetical protein
MDGAQKGEQKQGKKKKLKWNEVKGALWSNSLRILGLVILLGIIFCAIILVLHAGYYDGDPDRKVRLSTALFSWIVDVSKEASPNPPKYYITSSLEEIQHQFKTTLTNAKATVHSDYLTKKLGTYGWSKTLEYSTLNANNHGVCETQLNLAGGGGTITAPVIIQNKLQGLSAKTIGSRCNVGTYNNLIIEDACAATGSLTTQKVWLVTQRNCTHPSGTNFLPSTAPVLIIIPLEFVPDWDLNWIGLEATVVVLRKAAATNVNVGTQLTSAVISRPAGANANTFTSTNKAMLFTPTGTLGNAADAASRKSVTLVLYTDSVGPTSREEESAASVALVVSAVQFFDKTDKDYARRLSVLVVRGGSASAIIYNTDLRQFLEASSAIVEVHNVGAPFAVSTVLLSSTNAQTQTRAAKIAEAAELIIPEIIVSDRLPSMLDARLLPTNKWIGITSFLPDITRNGGDSLSLLNTGAHVSLATLEQDVGTLITALTVLMKE